MNYLKKCVKINFKAFLLLIIFVGCLGASEQTNRAYNVLGRSHYLDLRSDGYIIGIEKYERENIGNPQNSYPDRFKELDNPTNDKLISKQNKEFTKATSDKTAMVITHIASYFPNKKYIYNAYSDNLEGDFDYEMGYDGLSKLKNDIIMRIKKADSDNMPYSHIFIMSMGWNNDQFVSIYRFTKIIDNLMQISKTEKPNKFKPLIIGITWPSAWFTIEDSWIKKKVIGHIGSYANKSNDSDEIGYTIINWLIHNYLYKIRKGVTPEKFPKVIAVGHSMGARLLSMAIFSRQHLKSSDESAAMVDMFIGLQGAFSARRFVTEDSGEGAPYNDYKSISTIIVLTSSKNDKTNQAAIWSRHVGGERGLKYMKKKKETFKVLEWPQNKEEVMVAIKNYNSNMKIITIDASEIVTGSDAHNDILDEEMADLIMNCLHQLD